MTIGDSIDDDRISLGAREQHLSFRFASGGFLECTPVGFWKLKDALAPAVAHLFLGVNSVAIAIKLTVLVNLCEANSRLFGNRTHLSSQIDVFMPDTTIGKDWKSLFLTNR
jgi:hypothetical protein